MTLGQANIPYRTQKALSSKKESSKEKEKKKKEGRNFKKKP